MKRMLFPPLLALAAASMLHAPLPARAAEPAPVAASGSVLDPVGRILAAFQPKATFVGRTADGTGYVLLGKRAFLIAPRPDGTLHLLPAEPAAAKRLVQQNGWRI